MGRMQMEGYKELRESAAWLDLSGRGKILARGEDRARLLHAMTTNHVEQLRPGRGCYALFLNAQGRILADVNLFCGEDYFLLDTEPETTQKLHTHVEKHIIADDVALEELTSQMVTLGLEGPGFGNVLNTLGAPLPEAPYSHVSWGMRTVARVTSTGADGVFLFLSAPEKDELVRQLESAGAVLAAGEAARAVRLEHGKPRYGEDFTDAHIPHETQLLSAVHFSKGCYLGQEIVERVRSRGHVNRLLVQLEIDAEEPPAAGEKVLADGKEAGEITSAAWSPALGKVAALGYLRTEYTDPGRALCTERGPARMSASTPAQV